MFSKPTISCSRKFSPRRAKRETFRKTFLGFALAALLVTTAAWLPAGAQMMTANVNGTPAALNVSVTLSTGGTLNSILVLTEGTNGLDFGLASGYTCQPGTYYGAGTVCTIPVTFAPRFAGLRKGGVVLKDASGNALGTAFLSGQGVGPQAALTPSTPLNGSTAKTVFSLPSTQNLDNFAFDGAGNIFILANDQNGSYIYKETKNGNGTYTQSTLTTGVQLAFAFDGLGDVYYTTNDASNNCNLMKLVPTNNGYVSVSVYTGKYESTPCPQYALGVDGYGTVYFTDSGSGQGAAYREVYSPTGYSQRHLSPATGPQDFAVDAAGDVYLAQGNSDLTKLIYNASTDSYSTVDYVNYTGINANVNTIAIDASGSIYYTTDYGDSPVNKITVSSSTSFGAFLSNGQTNTLVRTDAAGNVYFVHNGASLYEIDTQNPPTLTFPITTDGSTSAAQNLVLTNVGNSSLTASSPGIAVPANFVQTAGGGTPAACTAGFSLVSGASCNVSVAFAPTLTAKGTVTGSATLTDNAFNVVPTSQSINLSGTAVHLPPTISSVSPSSGAASGGTTVTLTGTNLGDVSSVTFNSTAATFSLGSSTQMTVTSPAGTPGTTAAINVTNPGGTTSNGNNWTWNNTVSAGSSTLSVSPGSVAQGSASTITATILDGSHNPVANSKVVFTSSNPNIVNPPSAVTNASGVAVVTVPGLYPGSASITMTADGTSVSQARSLTVTPAVVPVRSSLPSQVVSVPITKAGTLTTTTGVSQGAATAEFAVTGGCGTGQMPASTACVVTYTFAPSAPGMRQGAIVLKDNSGNVMGQAFVFGIGTSPQGLFSQGTQTQYPVSGGNISSAAVDGAGNVYYTDQAAGTLSKLALNNSVTTIASGINTVTGVAVDGAGNVFYGAYGSNQVYELVGGSGTPQLVGSVPSPNGGIKTDGFGNIYSSAANGVVRFDAVTHAATSIGGASGSVPGLAVDVAGNVYFCDYNNSLIYEAPANSTTGTVVVSSGLNGPRDLAIDAAGDLYVANRSGGNVLRLAAGTYAPSVVATGAYNTIVTDAAGDLVVSLTQVNKINRTGVPALSFPATVNGMTSAPMLVPFENDGNLPLTVSAYAASTNFNVAGAGNTCATGSLAASSMCTLGIVFAPVTAGTLTGTANITGNNLNGSGVVQSVQLSGTASPANQTITFPQPATPVAAGASVTLTATASSGLAVVYTIASGPATVSGSTVTYTGAGTVVITANQPGNAGYYAATAVSNTVTVASIASTFASPSTPVGTTTGTQTAYVTFTTSGTIGTVSVSTQGAQNLDYRLVSGGTCTAGTAFAQGQYCTVLYTFGPTAPGQRMGGVNLTTSSGALLGTSYLSGLGTGPQGLFSKGTTGINATGLGTVRGMSVDGNGNVYFAATGTGAVSKVLPNGVVQVVLANVSAHATAVDGAGNLYFSNGSGISEIINGSAVPIATLSSLDDNLEVDGAGNLYASVTTNGAIYKIASGTHSVTTLFSGGAYRFVGMGIDAAGNLYPADFTNNVLYELPVGSSSLVKLVSGGSLSSPHAVAVDPAGNLYVCNFNGTGILRYTAGNYAVTTLPNTGARSIAIDASGTMYAAPSDTVIQSYVRATTPALAFPSTSAAASSAPSLNGFENDGNMPLNIASLTISPSFNLSGAGNTCAASPLAAEASCTLSIVFAPTAAGTATGNVVFTDNSLNAVNTLQTIALSGTGTTGSASQSITFPQPAPGVSGSSVTLTASSTSGLTVTYMVTGGPATVAGSTLTYTGAGSITVTASQGGSATYAAATPVSVTVQSRIMPTILWNPTSSIGYARTPISSGVLDASSVPGTITYTATSLQTGNTVAITASSTLPAGAYTLTASLVPTDTTTYTNATANLPFTVYNQTLFVANSSGSVASFFTDGSAQTGATAGGGTGAAIDASGAVWSIDAGGSSVSRFSYLGVLLGSYSGAGINAATALAIDGAGVVWITNGNGTVSALNSDGTPYSNSSLSSAGGISGPSAVSVSAAGSLWVANAGNNSVTEIIGVASPAITPNVTQVINATAGTRP